MSVQLPFGLHSSGRMIAIGDAERGAACDCTCAKCGRRLIAKKGPETAHHFAHEADADCAGATESMLHKLAKQVLVDAGHVWFPELVALAVGQQHYIGAGGLFEATVIELERAIEDLRPDAILTDAKQTQLAVEIYVRHVVSPEKATRYAELATRCIEIDLSAYHGPRRIQPTADQLPDIILRTAPRRWIYSPPIAAAVTGLLAEHEARELARREMAAEQERARLAQEAERWARLSEEQKAEEERRKQQRAEYEATQAERRREAERRYAAQQAKWEQEEKQRLASLAVHRAATASYRDAERAEATQWTARHPDQWAFGLDWVASKFLVPNDAIAWTAQHVNPILLAGTEMGPPGSVACIPDASTVDALYDELWAEIVREGRYHGP